jgi:vacuolar-type H+-ATPase subunit H
MYFENATGMLTRPYSEIDSHRRDAIVGMQDKFNEAKDKYSDNAENARDRGEELYNKAQESPAGERLNDVTDSVRDKARDARDKVTRSGQDRE